MTIENYILKNGPCLSSELIEYYSSAGTSDEAIRKRLSRIGSPILKLSGFFQNRQVFFYHIDQQFEDIYFINLRKALQSSAKRYYSIIKAIEYHNGYINKDHLASYSISPVKNLKSHKNFKTIIDELKKLKFISEDDESYILNEKLSARSRNNYNYYKAIELSKDLLLHQFNDFTKSIGLISYNTGTNYSEYSKFQFCFTAPSYVNGITTFNLGKPNPAFVLADVLLGNFIGEDEIFFFLSKIAIIKSQSKSNFLPFLIVDNVSQEALKLLKKEGIIVGFINKLFGSEYEELLKSLIATVTNAGTILKENPEAYLTLIEQFNKLIDGKTNNLKGDLFELAVGYYYSNLCQTLDISKIVKFDAEKREIDVLAFFQNEIIVCECKAYKTKIDLDTVEKWVKDKIPIIYKALIFNNEKDIIFEYWSTSGFTAEAIEYLENKKNSIRKYSINYYSEKEIMEKARESRARKITDIMRDYFIKNV